MSVRVAEGTVLISAQIEDSATRRSAAQAGQRAGDSFSRGFTQSADDGLDEGRFRRLGQNAGDGLVRGADGSLRDARTRFSRSGSRAGESFASGVGEGGSQGMGRASGKMSGALAGAGKAFATAGAVVGGIFAQAFAEAMSQEQSVAKLSAQVGAFGSESKKLGKVAGSLYADGYGEGFDDVTEALRGVKQNMAAFGAVGDDELKKIAKGSMNVATILGEEVGPTTRAVAKMVKTGLAKNAEEAFDILTKGAQNGANEAEDLLDTFSEYSTQFRNMGLDGKTAMGLISQGLKGGARDADVVADTIKEFSIEAVQGGDRVRKGFESVGLNADDMVKKFSKGGPVAAKAFGQVLDKLRGIDDKAKRNAVAVELFGTKAEDMGDALFSLDLDTAAKGLGDVGGAAKKAGDMLHSSLSSRLERLKRTMQQGLVDMITDHVLPVVDKFSAWMKENPGIVKPVIEGLKTLGLVLGGLALGGAIVAGLGFAFSLVSGPVLAVVGAIAGFTLGLKYAWEHSETFRDIVKGVWEKIKDVASKVGDFFKTTVWPSMLEGWDTIKEKGEVLLGFFKGTLWPILKSGWDILVAAVSPIIDRLKGFFDDLAGKGEGFKGLWESITSFIGDKLSGVWDIVVAVMDGIKGAWETHRDWILPVLTFLWSTIGEIIGLAMGNVWELIKGAWTAISGVISGAMRSIKGVIEIITGIITLDWNKTWTGIKNLFGGIWDSIVAILQGAWEAMSGIFSNMWNSVKGLFTKLGTWLLNKIASVVDGVVGWFRKMKDRATSLIGSMRDAVVQRFNNMRDRVVSFVTSLRDRAVGMFTSTRDRVYKVATWLRDKVVGAFNSLKDRTITAFSRAKDGVSKVWNKLKSIAAKPVNFVINSVYNNGIRKFWNAIAGKIGLGNLPELKTLKFQKGGTVDLRGGAALPGYSRTDDTLAMVRSGEGVLVPEAVNALGGAQFINRANRMKGAAGRLVGGNNNGSIPGFAKGGIIGAVGSFINKGKNFFKEGFVKALSAVTNPIVNAMKSRFGSTPLKGLPTLAVQGIVNKIKGFLGPKANKLEGGNGGKVVSTARSQVGVSGRPNKYTRAPGMWTDEWCGMFVDWVFKKSNANKALSGIRTPAVASYTGLSKVGKGSMRPGDLALYRGDTGHINIVTDPKTGETVGGNEGNNQVKKTRGYVNSASSIRRPKGFATGGIVDARQVMRAGGLENLRSIAWQDRVESPNPGTSAEKRRELFSAPPWVSRDMGGLLPDGMMAYNTSGTAEVVSTLDQLKALVASGKGQTYIFNEGAIQLDASKVKSIQDVVDMIDSLKVTSRQFGARI